MTGLFKRFHRNRPESDPCDSRGGPVLRSLMIVGVAGAVATAWLRAAEPTPAPTSSPAGTVAAPLSVRRALQSRIHPSVPAAAGDQATSPILRLVKPFPENGENIAGDGQIALAGARLNRPLVVRVVDAQERPVADVPVYYLVVQADGGRKKGEKAVAIPAASPASPLLTDADGFAILENVWVDSLGLFKVVFFTDADNPGAGGRVTYSFEGRSPSWFNWMTVGMAGGLALFLLGAKLTGEGLGRLAGMKLRETVSRLDAHPIGGVGAGAAVTFLTQSSSASTTLFVSFAAANTMKMRQALPLIYGSAIGTTITVQLLAFDVYRYALIAVAIGVALQLLAGQRARLIALGQGLLGFGLIFHGMHVMVLSVDPLRRLPWLAEAMFAIKDYPGWALMISMAFTAMVQSSAAVLGLVLALAQQDLISPLGAVPLIFGANIGTTVTALMAGMGLSREARRVAVAHLVFKVLGVALFLPLMGVLAWLGAQSAALLAGASTPLAGGELARAVANIHTIFNVLIAFVALPFSGRLEGLVRRIIPQKPDEGEGKLKYLDLPVLASPSLVYGAALREISRMSRFVEEQMKAAFEALFDGNESRIDYIHRRDDKVDNLQRNIIRYLTDVMRRTEAQEDSNRYLGLVQIVSDIENIGDLLDKDIAPLARKMILNGLRFAPETEKELKDLFLRVGSDLSTLFVALSMTDRETARTVRSHRAPMAEFSQKMLIKHLTRLQEQPSGGLDVASVSMDLVNYLQRIEFHIYRIAGISAGDVTFQAEPAES